MTLAHHSPARTPERDLAVAVVERAVMDLDVSRTAVGAVDPSIRREAVAFFTAGGRWAESRNLWLSLLGLDEVAVHAALKDKLGDTALTPYRLRKPDTKPTAAPISEPAAAPTPEPAPPLIPARRQHILHPLPDRLVPILAKLPSAPFAARDVLHLFQAGEGTVRDYVSELTRLGYLVSVDRGRYAQHDHEDARLVLELRGTPSSSLVA